MAKDSTSDRAARDAMSATAKPPSGKRNRPCQDCPIAIALEQSVSERLDQMEHRISHAELSIAELSGKAIQAIDSIPVIIKTALSVRDSMRRGADVESTTPGPKLGQAELSTPIGKLRGGQRWLAVVMISMAIVAGVAWVAGTWGPPSKRAQPSGAPPK